MKGFWVVGAALFAGVYSVAPASALADTCVATCNAANAQCSQAGKNESVCLNAWHQCKAGCAKPATLTVSRPAPNTVVIKSNAPIKKR